jgi:hypothetical protein
VWKAALKTAKLVDENERPIYRLHDLRHTAVSRLVEAGADVVLVQAVAGHSDPRVTLARYTHLRDAGVTEAAERFDPAREAQSSRLAVKVGDGVRSSVLKQGHEWRFRDAVPDRWSAPA